MECHQVSCFRYTPISSRLPWQWGSCSAQNCQKYMRELKIDILNAAQSEQSVQRGVGQAADERGGGTSEPSSNPPGEPSGKLPTSGGLTLHPVYDLGGSGFLEPPATVHRYGTLLACRSSHFTRHGRVNGVT